jgi:outer membrane protein OmpA-like peptidoglycan-associated protein
MQRLLIGLLLLSITACTYTMKIRDGRTAYERKQFAVAAKMLPGEIKKLDSRVEKGKLAFLLADAYIQLNRPSDAVEWYQTAYDYGYGVEALEGKAYTLKRMERYEEAILAFRDLGFEIGSPYEYRREISACEVAQGWKDIERQEYRITNAAFNTGDADYAPVLYKDNSLVITSDRSTATGEDTYNWTGNDFSDLFLVDLSSGDVTPFEEAVNTPDNEGTIAFNEDYSMMIFTRCTSPSEDQDAYCQLYVSERNGARWSRPRPLSFQDDNVNYMHPVLAPDGSKLYFSANHPEGWGGYDIYVSTWLGDDWDVPRLLGRSVNTPGNEQFPTLDRDTLYFSSNRHNSMGGLDIFRSYEMANGNWAPAFNLKPPINSGADDFALVIDRSQPTIGDVVQRGYFSSSRYSGSGRDDIYTMEKVILPPPPEPDEPEVTEEVEPIVKLDVYVLEKIYQDPTDPNSRVLGRRPLPGASLALEVGNTADEVTVGEDGKYSIELEEGKVYEFLAKKEGYLNNDATFSSQGIAPSPDNPVQTYELEIELDKIFLDREIVLENIYYDFDKWDIRQDAEPTLDELTRNLRLNPEINIQLASHTDCRGNDRYNQQLSQRRAQSAVDYLIAQGIDEDRLSAVGYGEEQPAVDCICARCTEDEHQSNRRTTFKIVEN